MVKPEQVGEMIATLRKAQEMTQAELGEKLHVSFQAVSKWERGETLPDTTLLPELAMLLGTTVDYLLCGGARQIAFRGKLEAKDALEGVRCLDRIGVLWRRDNPIYQYLIDGLCEKMNSDIRAMLEDSFLTECLAVEVILHNMDRGYCYSLNEMQETFTHDKWRQMLLERAQHYGMI